MIHHILLLGNGSSFMVNALSGNLARAGYEVIDAEPRAKSPEFDAAILFLDSEILSHKAALSAFGDLCAEERKPLFVIGSPEELDAASKRVPEEIVTERMEKPLNIKALIDKIRRLDNPDAPREARKQILLADDDPDYLKLVSRWLSGKYRVVVVNSGTQAIAFLGSNRPDLILLDYNMPVISGPQTLEMIRSEPSTKNIPVFFLTGKNDSESVNRVLEFRPEGYILKDISRNALIMRLEKFFEGAE